ncbi:hypothetical protein D3C78_583100 [compost metagenome]
MNKQLGIAVTALGLFALTGTAQAVLTAVDPGPYTAATGKFPLWYQDQNAVSLELCQSKAVSPAVGGAPGAPAYLCTILPEPGVYDDTQPMVFPDNWPSELFWFLAETSIPASTVAGYSLDVYVAGIEAAFAGGPPLDGDQQSFARIRIRASVPVAGTYTITHPYGVETINVTAPGNRAINFTSDIGIGAPGDFSGALTGAIGPFLSKADGTRVTATNPETGALETFIGDPNVPGPVAGGLNDINYVQISGPAGTIRTDQFILSGKISDSRAPTVLEVERSTYNRAADGSASISVFAKTPVAGSDVCYRETLELVPGTTPSPCLYDLTKGANGYHFGNNPAPQPLPQFLVLTASDPAGVTRPTPLSSKLIDVVKIGSASYSWADRKLTIQASSSDESVVPDLVAQGYGPLSKAGTLQSLSVDLLQPPASVTVKSAFGGVDTEPVTVVGSAPVLGPNQLPLAQADSANTTAGVPVTVAVLANDSDPDNDTPLSVVGLTALTPGQGSIVLSGNSVVYTPPAVVNGTPLVETFTYRVQDARGGQSEPATVTLNVAANQAPTAVNDTAAATTAAITINVLGNDTDPEGNLPLSVVGLTSPAAGQGTVTSNGTSVTYTPPPTVTTAFTATFTYQAQDSLGAVSATPATVSVSVTPPPVVAETLTATSATVRVRGTRYRWDLSGQTSQPTGNTIRVSVSTLAGPLNLGTATLSRGGRWRLTTETTGTAALTSNPTATVTSAFGKQVTVPLTVR